MRSWRRIRGSCRGAGPVQAALADAVERVRRNLALLLDEDALLESACAAALPAPGFEGGPVLAAPGPGGSWLLQEAWARWQQECVADWTGLEAGRGAAVSAVYGAFGSRRRGREEALDVMDRLVDEWNGRARALAVRHADGPRRPLTIDLPPLLRGCSGEEEDRLTRWEAGVLAVHQVAVHWPGGSVDLLVPRPVADQLLRGSSLTADGEGRSRPDF